MGGGLIMTQDKKFGSILRTNLRYHRHHRKKLYKEGERYKRLGDLGGEENEFNF